MFRSFALAATLVSAAALAGCTDTLSFGSTDDVDGFSVSPDAGDKDTVFKVSAASGLRDRNLTWEWGDGTRSYGAEAEHRYGFTNGVMTITLIATSDDGPQVATKTVTLGSGINKVPTGSMSAQKRWVEVGRPVNLTANGNDADGDPLTYLWTYTVVSGGVASDGHAHEHGGSTPTGGEVVIEGSERKTAVTFDAAGKYEVTVRIRDPKNGETIANTTIDVSKHIPDARMHVPFTGHLVAGAAGASASEKLWMEDVPDTSIDTARHAFELRYPATIYALLQWTDPTNASAMDLDLEIRDATGQVIARSETHAVNASAPAPPLPIPPLEITYADAQPGTYTLVVKSYAAAQVDYTLDLYATLRITPELVAAAEG